MKVNYQRDVKHSGTLDAAGRRKMTIDENSLQHLMSLLTDIYSDPDFAVIREYSLNALDSHAAAGNDDPIMVELPNDMRPTYVVRDQGVGMSVDEVLNHLSKYGASTKRDTDEETGMLGIGFKAALTYTSQFTCTVVKDGVKAVVLVARDDDGVGSVQIVDTLGTDQPNGVEVQVPVSNIKTFNQKARWFFRFWEDGKVLVNGEVPDPITGQWLDDGVVLVDSTNYYHDDGDYSGVRYSHEYVVMGNIPYPVESNQMRLCPLDGKRAIIWVPMGAVNFAPSREALTYTDLTKETLSDANWWIKNHLIRIAQDEVDACDDFKEAFESARKWWAMGTPGRISFKELTYHNQDIPEYVRIPGGFRWNTSDNVAASYDAYQTVKFADMVGVKYYQGDTLAHAVHVVNHPNKTWAGINRKKFYEYCEQKDIQVPSIVYIYKSKVANLWMKDFDNVDLIDFDDISNMEVSRGSAGDEAAQYRRVYWGESYDDGKKQYDEFHGGIKVNLLDSGAIPSKTRVIYFSPTELDEWRGSVTKALDDEDAWYILINKNRWSKFLREEAPHAEHLYDAIKEAAEEFVEGLSQADLVALNGSGQWNGSPFSVLKSEHVQDPELRDFIQTFGETDNSIRSRWSAFRDVQRAVGGPAKLELPIIPEVDFHHHERRMRDRYPLLEQAPMVYRLRDMKEDVLTYINATHQARSHSRYLENLQLTQPDEGSDDT